MADGDILTYIYLSGRTISEFGAGAISLDGAIIKNGEKDNTSNYYITYKVGLLTKNYEVRFVISKDCFTPALKQDIVYKTVKTTDTGYNDCPDNMEVETYLKEQYGIYPVDFRWRDKFGYTPDTYNTLSPTNNIGYGTFWCDDISFDFYDADGLLITDDGYSPFKVQNINDVVLPAAPKKENDKEYISGWSLSENGEILTEDQLKERLMQADFEGRFDLYAVYKPCNFTASDIKFTNENGTEYTKAALNSGEAVKATLNLDTAFGICNPTLILAVYDGDSLAEIVYTNKATADGLSIETPLITAGKDNLTARAFVWSSMSDITPLCESVSIGQ